MLKVIEALEARSTLADYESRVHLLRARWAYRDGHPEVAEKEIEKAVELMGMRPYCG